MPKQRILCVSFDRMVSESRCAALNETGYDVTPTTDIKEALGLLARGSFDAVIVGHRFPAEEKYMLATEAKEKLNTPVLLVCGATRDPEIPATGRVYALEGTSGLLSALSALFSAEPGSRPRVAA